MTIKCDVSANPGSRISWVYGPDKETAQLVEADDKAFVMKNQVRTTDTRCNVSYG